MTVVISSYYTKRDDTKSFYYTIRTIEWNCGM